MEKPCSPTGVKSEASSGVDLNIKEEEMEIKEEPVEVEQEVEESGGAAGWGEKQVLPCSRSPETAPEANKQQPQVEARIEDKLNDDKTIDALEKERHVNTNVMQNPELIRELFGGNGDSASESGSEYFPGSSDEEESDESYVSGESELEYDSDEELCEESEPLIEDGWQFMSDPFADARPDPLPVFSDADAGIAVSVPRFTCPREAFCYFLDNVVIGKLCEWMNAWAAAYFTFTRKRKVNGLLWRPVAADEMYVFLSLLLVMGVNKRPHIYMYWSRDVMVGGPKMFCKEVMARARFLCLLKFLRFTAQDQVDKKCPKTHVEPFLDLLRQRSQSLLTPGKDIAVDEALMLWKGRLGFKHFIPTSRSRFGIRVAILCPSDPRWSGYSWNFEVYNEKDTSFSATDPAASRLTKPEVVVVHLMRDLLDKGRHVVTDNWYTSYRLSSYLLTRETLLTGVVRADRVPPRRLMAERLERHQAAFARKNNTLVVKYMDREEVNVLTTQFTAGLVEKTKTIVGDKTVFYYKPLHIDRYNSLMGSADMADQLLEPYECAKKSLAWFKKLGIHFIFRVLLNSYLAYRNQQNYSKDFLLYVIQVSEELASNHSAGARAILQKAQEEKMHRPRKMPKADLLHAWVRFQPKKQKKCRLCSRAFGKRKDTVYHCPGCPGEPGLCSQEHFMAWHTDILEGGPRSGTKADPKRGPKAGSSRNAHRDQQ